MKKIVIASLVAFSITLPAAAQHSHGNKGPNGGPMEDIAGVHAELTRSGNTLSFHISDENGKPVSTKAYSGSALVATGNRRETVSLAPSGDNRLTGDVRTPLSSGALITLQLKTDEGRTGQVRFKQ